MISFTGSTRAGKRVSEVASGTVKRVALELGGKSPNVILDDADIQQAVVDGIGKCYLNSGQTCSALTRMLVPRDKLPAAEQIAAAALEQIKVGDPFEPDTTLGPLVSETQRERVRGYIRKGQEEGAKLVAGGEDPPEGADKGYFVQPTVFSEVTPEMTIAQEEIFGPVLALMPYDDEEEAVRIANSTMYGLAGGVWSGDPTRSASRGGCGRARWRSTAPPSTRSRRSAATSSRATAASSGASGSRSSSRRRRYSSKEIRGRPGDPGRPRYHRSGGGLALPAALVVARLHLA
jgi:acyl-CoA reductase-like NAD-dependent aldehyde dehydrogenase